METTLVATLFVAMARQRNRTDDEILHTAMRVFWRRGYAATSIQDLTEATGATRSTLYRSFESKQGLFRAAMDHYAIVIRASVNLKSTPLEQLNQWFEAAITRSEQKDIPSGCLLVNAASDPSSLEPGLMQTVREHLSQVQMFFRYATSAMGSDDSERDAAVLMGANYGVFLLSNQGAPSQHLRAVVNAALAAVTPEES